MRTFLLLTFLGIGLVLWAQNPVETNPQYQGFQSENIDSGFLGQNNWSIVTNNISGEDSKNSYSPSDNFAPQQVISIPQGWSGISGFIIPDISGVETLFKPVMDKFVILYNQDGMFYPDQNINTLVNWDPQAGYIAKFNQAASLGFSGQVNSNRTITLNAGWNLIPVLSNCPVNVADFFQNQDLVVVKDVATYKLYWPVMGINTLNELLPGKAYYVLMNAPGEITFPDCTIPAWQCGEPFVDPRDSRVYNTVQIGAQCWMAQNLNYGSRLNGSASQTNNNLPEKYCYNDQEANCYIYGGLYQWNEMMQYSETPGTQGLCPEGWYTPKDAEWTWLANYLGGVSTAAGAMKETGTAHWSAPNTSATNSSGFTALPGGTRDLAGAFSNQNFFGNFWTSTGVDADLSTRRILAYNQAQITANSHQKTSGLSVRCRKREILQITPESQTVDHDAGSVTFEITSSSGWIIEESSNWLNITPMSGTGNSTLTVAYQDNIIEEPRIGEITVIAAGASPVVLLTITQSSYAWMCGDTIVDGRDSKIYQTVQIGNQCWLAQNLNIGVLTSEFGNQTNNSTIEKYCLGNDMANCDIYGGLYQWDEMMQYSNGFGLKGICPEGWHLPSATEWDILTNTLDGTFLAGGKLKTTGTIEEGTGLWYAPNSGADNSSGFSMLPSSFRQAEGGVAEPGYFSMMWSTDYNSALPPTYVALNDTPEFFYINSEMTYGNSVRCIMNDVNHKFTEISPSRSEVPAQAGSFVFTVNSNAIWSVSEDVPWLTVTPSNGSNNGQINVNYEANSISEPREGVIQVQSESQIIELHLTQAAFIAHLDVTPTSKVISTSSGSTTFEITSNSSWTVEENIAWFSVSPITGRNNDTLTLTYDENNTNDMRIGQFTVTAAGGSPMVTIIITQTFCGYPIIDARDGKTYTTVKIGTQCWMGQNLNIGTRIDGTNEQTDNGTNEKYCYDNSETNCDVYGGLYQWNEMMQYSNTPGVQGICPAGWHIPTDNDWCNLTTFLDSTVDCSIYGWTGTNVGNMLKEAGTLHWASPNIGATNSSGFTGLPGGYLTNHSFHALSYYSYWWSSTKESTQFSWNRILNNDHTDIGRYKYYEGDGLSVRCLKDENLQVTPSNKQVSAQSGTTNFNISSNSSWIVTENVSWLHVWPISGTDHGTLVVTYYENIESTPRVGEITITASGGSPMVVVTVSQAGWSCGSILTDTRDDKNYTTVQIGEQCWMGQNLNVGEMVNGGFTTNQTNNGAIEKYCWNNSESNCNVYGGLYQWGEMMKYSTIPGVQGICPIGWHVPNDGEWTVLEDFVSSQPEYLCNNNTSYIAKALASTTGWSTSSNPCAIGNNIAANNTTEFSGRAAGHCMAGFGGQGEYARLWSSTLSSSNSAWTRDLNYSNSSLSRYNTGHGLGISVRCLKDKPNVQLSVNPSNLTVSSLAGTTSFEITSNTNWIVEENTEWFSVIQSNGSNNAFLTVNYTENITSESRNGEIIITVEGGWPVVVVTLTQSTLNCGISINDSRDGKTYTTVQIGTQCWMAQNLNIGTMVTSGTDLSNNGILEKYCYDDNESNCDIYGGLYQWNEMMQYSTNPGVQGICPSGWHIPTDSEWITLSNYLGGESVAGGKMKMTGTIEAGTGLWFSPNTGATNSIGFTALPAGGYSSGSFYHQSAYTGFWSATQGSSGYPWTRDLYYSNGSLYRSNPNQSNGFSVRCLKDNPTLSVNPAIQNVNFESGSATIEVVSNSMWSVTENTDWLEVSPLSGNGNGTLTITYIENTSGEARTGQIIVTVPGGSIQDTVNITQVGDPSQWQCDFYFMDVRDSVIYSSVQIGTQCWMAQNLNVGSLIAGGANQTNNNSIEKYCYNNSESNCNMYGGLYQWNEMMGYTTSQGVQGICPQGWHVPTDGEWTTLSNYLGGESVAGGQMKTTGTIEAGTGLWYSPNTGATNSSGFSGLPAGYYYWGSFSSQGTYSDFWSATQGSSGYAWYRNLSCSNGALYRNDYYQSFGFSVRCLKDETTTSLLEVSPSNQDVTAQSGTTTFNISSNTLWTVSEDVSWLSVSPTSGSDNETLTVTYDANTESTPRVGEITITADGGNPVVVVTVSQAGWSCGNTLTDTRDDKTYTTVQIGDQCWMGQNLNVGTRIAGTANPANNSVIEKYCYSNSEAQCDVYGGLYQWNEMMYYNTTPGVQGICMTGWHLPSEDEWTTLETYLGGSSVAGGKVKEAGTAHWLSPNTGATNSSGFTALPGGRRRTDGVFVIQAKNAYFWSSTQSSSGYAWSRDLYFDNGTLGRTSNLVSYGFSVRCLKD